MMTSSDRVKVKIYDDLDNIISATLCKDLLIFHRDLNERVSVDHQTWKGATDSKGVGKYNNNGLVLQRNCAKHYVSIPNTVFN